MARINVVGGGVVGLCCALRLQRDGHFVTIFESTRDRSPASWGNSGRIATEKIAPPASFTNPRSVLHSLFRRDGAVSLPCAAIGHWLPFGARMALSSTPRRFRKVKVALSALMSDALPAWARLTNDIAMPSLLKCDGHYVIWESEDSGRIGNAFWLKKDIGTASREPVWSRDLRRLNALTSVTIDSALRFRGSGQIADLGLLAQSLEAKVCEAGGAIRRETARIQVMNSVAQVVGHESDLVLITAGVRSEQLMTGLGHKTPIIAARGYHIRSRADHWPIDLPPIIFEDRSMIVTRYADCVQAASFVELATAHAPPDPRKWERLERHVVELGLPMAPPFTRWMGARPTLPDYLPAIGRSTRLSNLLYAFGHQHLGLTLAATTADIMTDLVADRPARINLEPFDLDRFARLKG